jgi:hypothetical protein
MGSLFGCGRAVLALTIGLPLPIISAVIVRGGAQATLVAFDLVRLEAEDLASVRSRRGGRRSKEIKTRSVRRISSASFIDLGHYIAFTGIGPMLAVSHELHANLLCDSQRRKVAGIDVRNDALQTYSMKSMFNDWTSSFRCKPVSPSRSIRTPADLDVWADPIIGDEKNPPCELVTLCLGEDRPVSKTVTR